MPDELGSAASRRELSFSPQDVESFAAASGDHNPLHVDAGFARRTPFGTCVVHGALVAIGLLGSLPPEELASCQAVRIRFAGPVLPGASGTVLVRSMRRAAGAWEAQLVGRGKVLARAVASPDRGLFRERRPGSPAEPTSTPDGAAERAMLTSPAERTPAQLSPPLTVLGRYSAGPELATLAGLLGAERLDPALLQGLAWASYVVGMELPGLYSLLAGITLATSVGATGLAPERHAVRVRELDPRTGQLIVDGELYDQSGAPTILGSIESFSLSPVGPPDPEALGIDGTVEAERGSVVVVGASRGFGAALTLALLARGYGVHAAYSSSAESAEQLTSLAGPYAERLVLHRLDARDSTALEALADTLMPRAPLAGIVLGAALPPLPMGLSAASASELADYVGESLRLAAVPLGALRALLEPDAWILFCSSAAVLAPPRDWPHYVAAKGALEGLARWAAASAPGLRAVVLRPPAMRTQLTNTPSGRVAAVPTEPIAAWIAGRLAGGELPPGLSVLEPDPVAEVA